MLKRLMVPIFACLSMMTAASSAQAQTQSWPAKPIRIVVPWSAGTGGTDMIARVVADKLRVELGQPVLIENRPGASGNIGAEYAARQPADGYTLMITSASFAIAPSMYKLAFDPAKDFVAVTKMAVAPLLVLVAADSPFNSMADLVAAAKKNPGSISFASFGNGSPSHLIGDSINRLAGIAMTHVPYTGGGAAADVMTGRVTVGVLDALAMTPQVKAGKLKALAINGTQRSPSLPEVPTLTESGVDFKLVGWQALFAPAGTSPEIVQRLNTAVNKILAEPDVQAKLIDSSTFPVKPASTPEGWGDQFRHDVGAWGQLVKLSGAAVN